MCPGGFGRSAQLLASQSKRGARPGLGSVPHASAGPGGCRLCAERRKAPSLGLKDPPNLPPLCV